MVQKKKQNPGTFTGEQLAQWREEFLKLKGIKI